MAVIVHQNFNHTPAYWWRGDEWTHCHVQETSFSTSSCCCSQSASRFNMLCVQRCSSADLSCNDL